MSNNESVNPMIDIKNCDGIDYLKKIKNNSIDLILTDPPYLISKDSGMNKFQKKVKKIEESGENQKTEQEWEEFKKDKNYETPKKEATAKKNYLKYGNVSWKKFGYNTDYGVWDKEFTIEELSEFIKLFYNKLRIGGTCIIFFDLWKIETLKKLMVEIRKTKKKNWVGFKQIRLIEWIKTNPVPLNQSSNYLSNCREIAVLGVKDGKPTFHSSYDKGIYDDNIYNADIDNNNTYDYIYKYPIQSGKNRFHKTQKSLRLFEDLIRKHSNEGDIVLDTFLGGGTTAIACKNTNRHFKGCEINKEYYDKVMALI